MMKKIQHWLDENILLVLSCFLLVFIPLYPKIPLSIGGELVELLPGYIVRVRLEDLFILISVIIWCIQVIRKKISWKTPLTFVVALYILGGALSTVSGIVLTKTIPAEFLHVGKSVLHLFRYIEYFSLLFITYASIKSSKHLQIVLGVIVVTMITIIIYGYGQRNLYWPVYSTMNREFSKGITLYLSEHARVQSTFGGHYDLAAYLVIMIPLVLAASYIFKNIWIRFTLWIVFLSAYWLMMATASRTSYGAFFLAIGLTILLSAFYINKTWQQKLLWAIKEYFIIGIVSLIMLTAFGGSMYERVLQTLEPYPMIHNSYVSAVNGVVDLQKQTASFTLSDHDEKKLADLFDLLDADEPPENSLSTEEAEILVTSDTQPSTEKPSSERPSDVYVDVPIPSVVATVSADGTVSHVVVDVDRTWSPNALKYGLSMAIRLDTLWPRALQGFYNNPVFGSGYATLTKESAIQFTEAESTDNNFLRTLGETGLFGFITFYGAIILSFIIAFRLYRSEQLDTMSSIFVIAFMSATAGLLVNALFIDVFASSKVALSYWTFTGIILAINTMYKGKYFSFDFINKYFPKSNSSNTAKKSVTTKPLKRKKT